MLRSMIRHVTKVPVQSLCSESDDATTCERVRSAAC